MTNSPVIQYITPEGASVQLLICRKETWVGWKIEGVMDGYSSMNEDCELAGEQKNKSSEEWQWEGWWSASEIHLKDETMHMPISKSDKRFTTKSKADKR